ncbi:hypothetical protein [Paraburkholderia phenoliruptrix]|uniref:hypothetical protein n=1 Tax=Paraburkholderia phenoliruptrix TaxID=252970 RepID=UPI0034CF1CF5
MTDLELLIRAARAIGATDYAGPDDCSPPGVKFLNGVPTNYEGHGEWGYAWNPSANDDEALRLAVQLHIDLQFDDPPGHVTTLAVNPRSLCCTGKTVELAPDPQAAVRHAIVVTAAALAPQ